MDVADQFPKIDIFLTQNRFVTVLKHVPVAVMTVIERNRITSQQPTHYGGNGDGAGFEKKVEMIGDESPRAAFGPRLGQNSGQPGDEIGKVPFVEEYFATLDAAGSNVMQCSGGVYSGLAWHVITITKRKEKEKLKC